MKFVCALVFLFVVSAFADVEPEWIEIDWSKVVRITDTPSFWDGRDIRPAFYPGDDSRSGRIVGGDIVVPYTHPYQAGLLLTRGSTTALCGGSVISTRAVLTAAHW